MKNLIRQLLGVSIAVALASQARATIIATYDTANTPGTLQTDKWVIGGIYPEMNYFGVNGQWAYLDGTDLYTGGTAGNPGIQFGFQLTDTSTLGSYTGAQPSRVAKITGFTLEGDTGAPSGRKGLRDVTVHYGFGQTLNVTLPNTEDSQTVTFATPIYSPYIYITATSLYDSSPFGSNNDIGISKFIVEGDWEGAANEINLNHTATMSAVGNNFGGPAQAQDANAQINSAAGSIFFARNAGQDTLTATYGSSQTIGSIGLGLTLSDDFGGRVYPTQITLSYTGGSETIFLDGNDLSYGRYQLAAPVTTTFLTITFPDGSSGTGWANTGGNQDYGITEFQAFETFDFQTIPEPSTVLLLVVGGAIAYRKLRRQ
jgi:hypothetical protein